jgi:hypothetical protein
MIRATMLLRVAVMSMQQWQNYDEKGIAEEIRNEICSFAASSTKESHMKSSGIQPEAR